MKANKLKAIRQGPIKDALRVKQKRESAALAAANSEPESPTLTPQQVQRLAEYEMQKKLQQEYQAVQVVDESLRISGKDVPLPGSK